MNNKRLQRLTTLETTHKATNGGSMFTVAQWKQFRAGNLDDIPPKVLETLERGKKRGEEALARCLADWGDEDETEDHTSA